MKSIFSAVLISAFLFVLSSGAPPVDNRIAGGATSVVAIPYLVSVTINGTHTCGGFIYNKNYIVTVASCVFSAQANQVRVVFGQVNLIQPDVGEFESAVFRIIPHENYANDTRLNDIALLELATTLTLNATTSLLRYDDADTTSGVTGEFAGWGAIMNDGLPSTRLRKGTMTMPATCGTYTTEELVPNYMFCFGDSGADTSLPCQYDEGSPLIQMITSVPYAVGIMSKNKGCATGAEPTVFTRLTSYYSWLIRNGGTQPL